MVILIQMIQCIIPLCLLDKMLDVSGGVYNDSTVKTNMFSLDNNILKISTNSFWIRLHIRKL